MLVNVFVCSCMCKGFWEIIIMLVFKIDVLICVRGKLNLLFEFCKIGMFWKKGEEF